MVDIGRAACYDQFMETNTDTNTNTKPESWTKSSLAEPRPAPQPPRKGAGITFNQRPY